MIRQKIKDKVKDKIQRKMKDRIKDKERDSIDFGRSKVEPLFHSIFYPTLLSMVFASLFTVADGIFVGQGVGTDALAAINIVAPLFLMTTGIALMFGAGVSVVASIHLSRGNSSAYRSCDCWVAATLSYPCVRSICCPSCLVASSSSSKSSALSSSDSMVHPNMPPRWR